MIVYMYLLFIVHSFSVALNTRRDDVMCRTLKVFLKDGDNGGDVDSNIQLTHEQTMTMKLN